MLGDNLNQSEKAHRKKLYGNIIAACVVITFYFLLKNSRSVSEWINHVITVVQPIFFGFVMAFLMNPIMVFFESRLDRLFKKVFKSESNAKKANRTVSTIISLIVIIGIAAFIITAIVPNLISTIVYLASHIEDQIAAVLDWANIITKGQYEDVLMKAKDNNIGDIVDQGMMLLDRYVDYDQSDVMSTVTTSVIYVGHFVVGIIIGIFVSVYVLLSKETFKAQAKKIICGLFSPKYSNIILEISRKSADIFYGFIIGKIIDSIIIGIICYIGCLLMNMPYPILVSTIVGVTNFIPVFGPYIGAVPTVAIIFLTEPMKGIYFLIFVLILQQIDGNVIGPKILGDSTGVSSFWVVFAVVTGAGFFGVGGMIIAVPVVAVIYYIIGRFASYLVKRRGLPVATQDYELLNHIDLETNEIVCHENEPKKKKNRILSLISKKQKK